MENAASFTPEGGLVELGLNVEDDMVCLRVADQGPGVRPRHLPLIFERSVSFRSPAAGKSLAANEHLGLGLWVVKRNVEGLGGTVQARNRSGGGFEVIVRLRLEGLERRSGRPFLSHLYYTPTASFAASVC